MCALPCPKCTIGNMKLNNTVGSIESEMSVKTSKCCFRRILPNSQLSGIFRVKDLQLPSKLPERCHKDYNVIENNEEKNIPILFKCNICDNDTFESYNKLKNHPCVKKLFLKPKGSRICPKCNKKFDNTKKLGIHLRYCHSKVSFVCQICKQVFPQMYLARNHMNSHTGAKPFSCSLCLRGFPTTDELRRHRQFHHLDKGILCDSCQELFPTKQMLENHIRAKHTKERSLVCEICAKTFLTTNVYYQHRRIHLNGKKFSCSQCNKKFTRETSLRRHQIIHQKQKICYAIIK